MVDGVIARNLMHEQHDNPLTGADMELTEYDWNSKLNPRHQSQQGNIMDQSIKPRLKDYLGFENTRNKTHAATYERFLRAALPGCKLSVLVGHHICLEIDGDLETENEIPSADCLMFDHELMRTVFGGYHFRYVMQALAAIPANDRDDMLLRCMNDFNVPK